MLPAYPGAGADAVDFRLRCQAARRM
jgi:hypothetical protein